MLCISAKDAASRLARWRRFRPLPAPAPPRDVPAWRECACSTLTARYAVPTGERAPLCLWCWQRAGEPAAWLSEPLRYSRALDAVNAENQRRHARVSELADLWPFAAGLGLGLSVGLAWSVVLAVLGGT